MHAPSSAIDIASIVAGAIRRWKLIVGLSVSMVAAVYLLLPLLTPTYIASARMLMFDPHEPSLGVAASERSPAEAFDTVAINTEMEVFQSLALTLRVAERLRLYDRPEFQARGRGEWLRESLRRWGQLGGIIEQALDFVVPAPNQSIAPTKAPAAPVGASDPALVTAAEILARDIQVSRIPLSYVLVVSARSRDPRLAQEIVATTVEEYLLGQEDARKKALDQQASWLVEKLTQLKAEVASNQVKIEALKAKAGLSETGKGTIRQQQLADLTTQLAQARADADGKRAQLEEARIVGATAALQAGSGAAETSAVSQLQVQASFLAQQLARLRSRLGDKHAAVAAVASQLAAVKSAIANASSGAVENLETSYQVALRRQHDLEAAMRKLASKPNDAGDFAELTQLQRVSDADTKLYDAYLSQEDEIIAREALGGFRERVISPPQIPRGPTFPRPMLFYAGAAFSGLALGGMISIALDVLRPGVPVGPAAEAAFGVPVLGNIPDGGRRSGGASRHDRGDAGADGIRPFDLGESVRALRLGLRRSARSRSWRSLVVTSALPGEGKSSIASLLAASCAAAGERTLLVDADIRRRTLSRMRSSTAPGLADVLAGRSQVLASITSDPLLSCRFLSAGSTGKGAGDVLASTALGRLMADLEAEFDVVILDCPPLLPVADALTLSAVADSVLLVVDATANHAVSVREAIRLLRPEGSKLAGIVLNKMPQSQLRRNGYVDNYLAV